MKSIIRLAPLLLAAACQAPGDQDGANHKADDVTYEAIRFETSEGAFTAILYPEAAPETVARYLEYVDTNYFVGRSFDRAIPGFVIQATDCVLAVVAATHDNRTLPLEVEAELDFGAGALGIARAAAPNSGGPEFFVTDFAAGHLNGQYTVFGQVVEGMDAVRRAARVLSIDFTPGPVPAVFRDTCAVQPAEITATTRTTVTLPAEQAARLPLQTAERVRVGDVIYNLEWPANLGAGAASPLTLYITVYDPMLAQPAPADVSIVIDGAPPLAVTGDDTATGIYHFDWTPPGVGEFAAEVSVSGAVQATLIIVVP